MNGIVCPIDFSPSSLKALEFCVMLANHAKLKVLMYFTFTEQDFDQILETDHVGETLNARLAEINKRLESIKAEITKENEIEVAHKIDTGDFPNKFLEYLSENTFEYLIMGTSGMGQKGTYMPGSNTVEVIKKYDGKILCVPENCVVQPLKKIVYASDLDRDDKYKLQDVLALAAYFNSKINVVHLAHKPNTELAEEILSFAQNDKLSYDCIGEVEDVAEGIESVVKQKNAELLALFHKKRNIFAQLFHKSVTHQLAYYSNLPMLIIK